THDLHAVVLLDAQNRTLAGRHDVGLCRIRWKTGKHGDIEILGERLAELRHELSSRSKIGVIVLINEEQALFHRRGEFRSAAVDTIGWFRLSPRRAISRRENQNALAPSKCRDIDVVDHWACWYPRQSCHRNQTSRKFLPPSHGC